MTRPALPREYVTYPFAGVPDIGTCSIVRRDGVVQRFPNVDRATFEGWVSSRVIRVSGVVIFDPLQMELQPLPPA
jgi:hypothetical protein